MRDKKNARWEIKKCEIKNARCEIEYCEIQNIDADAKTNNTNYGGDDQKQITRNK